MMARLALACEWRWSNRKRGPSAWPGVVLSVPGSSDSIDALCVPSAALCDAHGHAHVRPHGAPCKHHASPRPFSGLYDKCEAHALLAHSRMTLSLAGDTSTTDRIFNAFETLTPIAVLDDEIDQIVAALPFGHSVPWRRLLLPLNSSAHAGQGYTGQGYRGLLESVILAAEAVPIDVLEGIQAQMDSHRRHVLWHVSNSLAPHNVLLEAQARATLVTSAGYRETVAQLARAKIIRAAQTLASTTPTHAYAKLDGEGVCCKPGSTSHVGMVPNGAAKEARACEAACCTTPRCRFFSHATAWENCILCAACNRSTAGTGRAYSSWRRVTASVGYGGRAY